MQKNAAKEPVTSTSNQYQRDSSEPTNHRPQSNEAAAGLSRRSSIQIAMESDIRQPRLHQHRLSLGNIPQDDFSGTYARGSTQQTSHSRSSSGNVQSTSGGGSPVSYSGNQGSGRAVVNRESGGSDSNSSSGGGGGGGGGGPPGGGDQRAMEERARLNQLMANFFLKLALVVVRSRMDVPPVFARGTATRKVNKWFNVELEETDIFREDLRQWKYSDAFESRPPPLIIETYLDAEELTPNQTLVIMDEHEKRHNVETTLLAFRNWRRGSPLNSKKEVVLERWRVDLSPPTGEPSPELAVVYKKSIVLFRSLFSYARLLPSWKLQKKLAKGNKSSLRICCRVINGDITPIPQPDPLEIALIPRETDVTNSFQFGAVESPAGTFTVKVDYRRQCEFRVDDSEALLSSHFLNLDEHYFKPSLHQRAPSQPANLPSREPGSLPSHNVNLIQRGDPSLAYGSLTSFHQVPGGVSQSPISALRNLHISGGSSAGSPSEIASIAARSAHGSKASLRSESGVQRRPSVSFMQPFKNPPVSASPSPAEQYGHSPRTSLTRITQGGGVAVPARQRPQTGTMSPSSLKSSIPAEGPTSNPATPGVRYSSSFGNRRPRHSSGASKTEDDNNSSGRGSLASSAAAPGSGFVETSAVANSGISEEDRSLTDFMSMLDQKKDLKIFDSFSESSGRRAVAALGKYQKMRDSNAALQDSMSSSLLLPTQPTSNPSSVGRTQPGGPPALSGASVSTSSSPGKAVSPHTPAIPSRLQQNETIVHDQTNEPGSLDEIVAQISPPNYPYRRRDQQEADPAPSAQTTSTNATTSPLAIPSSPRFAQTRRPNSESQEPAEDEGTGRFQSLQQMIGPQERPSTSLESLDRHPPFILADDSLTTRTPGLTTGQSSLQRQTTAPTSLGDNSSGDSRAASRTTSADRVLISAFGSRRPYRPSGTARPPIDGRNPSGSDRAMYPLDDELLFDFSDRDMVQRRSLDRSRGNSSGGDSRGGGRGI